MILSIFRVVQQEFQAICQRTDLRLLGLIYLGR